MVSSADSASPVREGEIIAGKYRVERVLGAGGMGVVVAAMHLELEQRVALKFLLKEAASNPEVAARFAREARSAAKIRSEHVARVIDVGTLDDGAPYMVMEYMDGEDLEQVLERVGPLPIDVATSYVLQASEAIAEAHALGIVHRDLKPSNLFLARQPNGDPVVKVLDFGISKTQSADQAKLTTTSNVVGSPLYMSPEQMTSSKTVDARSDLWALGAVLYELLSRRTPFTADTMPELVAAILQNPHEPIREHRPDVPLALEAAIHRCLEKTPARRFANLAELAAAIAPFGPPRSQVSVARTAHVLGVSAPAISGARASEEPKSVELARTDPPPALTPASPPATGASTGLSPFARTETPVSGPLARSAVPARDSHAPWRVAGIAGVALLLGAAGLVLWRTARAPTVASAVDPTAAAVVSATPSATASVPAPIDSAPLAVPVVPAASSVPSVVLLRPAPKAAGAPAVPLRSAASSAPVCHMVSYRDSDGTKRFKEDCK